MKRLLIIATSLLLTGCFEEDYCMYAPSAPIQTSEAHDWSDWTDIGWKDRAGYQQIERQCSKCKRKQLRTIQ